MGVSWFALVLRRAGVWQPGSFDTSHVQAVAASDAGSTTAVVLWYHIWASARGPERSHHGRPGHTGRRSAVNQGNRMGARREGGGRRGA